MDADNEKQLYALAAAKSEADIFPSTVTMDRIQFLWWALYGIVGAIVAGTIYVTVWVIGVQNQFDNIEADRIEEQKNIEIRAGRIATLEAWRTAQDRLNDATDARMNELRKDFDNLYGVVRKMEPEHNEMWWMKEMGLTNKDVNALRGMVSPAQSSLPAQNSSRPTPTPR